MKMKKKKKLFCKQQGTVVMYYAIHMYDTYVHVIHVHTYIYHTLYICVHM